MTQLKGAAPHSFILRVPTTSGNMYFKAVNARSPGEPAIIQELSKTWPDNVPTLLSTDLIRNWMLVAEFTGKDLHKDNLPDAQWAEAGRLFAQIQIHSVQNLNRWKELGCRDRQLNHLPADIDHLFANTNALTPGPWGLTKDQISELRAFAPTLKTLCNHLSNFAIPSTIVQQDFGHHNLIVNDHTCLFYDWDDTVIAHPFFSINRFLDFINPPNDIPRWDWRFDHPEDTRRRLIRDTYLKQWTAFEPMNRLQEAFALSRQLNEAYMAVRWSLERTEMEPGCPRSKSLIDYMPNHLQELLKLKAYFEYQT